jgi:acyl-CoA synthetase (AMP-forming)/AMP-acid ligase II
VPDEEWGERAHASVSFSDEATASVSELHSFLSDRLASFRRREIEILPALPKNSVGKIAKSQLREPFWSPADRQV